MPKSYLVTQLIHNGRAAWQVRQEVPANLCRRMSDAELNSIGTHAAEYLRAVIENGEGIQKPAAIAASAKDAKKKR